MSLKENSPPREWLSGGLGARGWSSHTRRSTPKIERNTPLRQAPPYNPLRWQSLGRGGSYDRGPSSIRWRHRGAHAHRQGTRQAESLACRDREGISQVAARRGHPSLSRVPEAKSEPYGLLLSEGDGASPRLPSLSPHLRADMNYTEYLQSTKWKKIRKRVLGRDRGKCRLCERRASQVHHGSYDQATMDGSRIDRLYSLCRACHELISFDAVGAVRPFKAVQRKTKLLDEKSAPRKRSGKRKGRRRNLQADEIRALSLAYAFGERRKG